MHAEGVFRTQEIWRKEEAIMIYPTNTGKSGEHLLSHHAGKCLDSGKLRMWGRYRILAAVRRGICLTSCWRQKIDENSHQ